MDICSAVCVDVPLCKKVLKVLCHGIRAARYYSGFQIGCPSMTLLNGACALHSSTFIPLLLALVIYRRVLWLYLGKLRSITQSEFFWRTTWRSKGSLYLGQSSYTRSLKQRSSLSD